MSATDRPTFPPSPTPELLAHAELLATSFARVVGRPLLPSPPRDASDLWQGLFDAPFALLSHGTETDPVFNYGNGRALALFELSWSDLIALPSRYSAEPENRETRAELLAQVARQGYIDSYSGVRISRTAKRFRIAGATVWNLREASGALRGQAAMFSNWQYL